MSGATTICERGHRVGTGRGQPWSSADRAAVKALLDREMGATDIANLLGFDKQRTRDLVRRLRGRAPRTGGKSFNARIKGDANIGRHCLRCRRPFVADSKVLFMCVPCREFARDAA